MAQDARLTAATTRSLRGAVAALRQPLLAWAASRAIVVGIALLAAVVLGTPERGVDSSVPDALAFLGAWDTTWYLDIATSGYDDDLAKVGDEFTSFAFFPLLPAILALAAALGVNPAIAAIVISNLAFLGALVALHALTRQVRDAATANLATWCLALAPPAVVASMAYTEGIALALVIGAALAAVRGRFALAGLAAALATIARPPGILAAALVGAIALSDSAPGRVGRLVRGVVPAVAALSAFLVWLWVTRGSPTLPIEAQAAWDRGTLLVGLVTVAPAEIVDAVRAVVTLDVTAAWWAIIRDVGFGALYVVLLVRLWRYEGGWRSPWVSYSILVLALPIASGVTTSLARLGLLAFPLAWPAADWIREGSPARSRWALVAALVGIVLFTGLLAIRSP